MTNGKKKSRVSRFMEVTVKRRRIKIARKMITISTMTSWFPMVI